MNTAYVRDLDLNLLRVFVAVADTRSATAAAARLYLTQPAISAALKRLNTAIGAPLFVRQARGLALTARGQRLLESVRPHLEGLLRAALSAPSFDPQTSDRTLRLGLSDANEAWLLPRLLRGLEREAPEMRLVAVPVQFRTVAAAFTTRAIEVAVTVADHLPRGTRRQTLFVGDFVCLFDPRHTRLGRRPDVTRYLQQDHVVVSYNGDLRGIVEDVLGLQRRVRVSVSSFDGIGAIVDGSALVATVPSRVAAEILEVRQHLRTAPLPFALGGTPMELLWRADVDDDDAVRFLRELIVRITGTR